MDYNSLNLTSFHLSPSSLTKQKRANSNTQDIVQKRHNIHKEQKRLANEFDEKATKLRNEYQRQMEDLGAEREHKIRDLKLQEYDIDFEESLLARSLFTPFSIPGLKVEAITISDDEDLAKKHSKVKPKLSCIVSFSYKHRKLSGHDSTNTTRATEAETPIVRRVSSKAKVKDDSGDEYVDRVKHQNIDLNSEFLVRTNQRAGSRSATRASKTSAPNHINAATSSSIAQRYTIEEYFPARTPSIVKDGATAASKNKQAQAERADKSTTATSTLSSPYKPSTKDQRSELETMFISKIKTELLSHLDKRLTPQTRRSFFDQVESYNGEPRHFFDKVIQLAKSRIPDHPLCCAAAMAMLQQQRGQPQPRPQPNPPVPVPGLGLGLKCWMELVVEFLAVKQREFRRYMRQYDDLQ